MTESRLYGATIAFECSKMKAKILELSKMALFQVDTLIDKRSLSIIKSASDKSNYNNYSQNGHTITKEGLSIWGILSQKL